MATYKQIQTYVRTEYGFVPKSCWIAHCKELCGLPLRKSRRGDKHVVHDESRYSESKVLAIINNQSSKIVVPKVLVLGFDSVLTDDAHVQPLKSLACISLKWVEKKIDELCNELQEEYNNKTYDELMALDNAQYTAPISAELLEGK